MSKSSLLPDRLRHGGPAAAANDDLAAVIDPFRAWQRVRPADRLPQLDGGMFLTDGGIETTAIFQHGIPLPCNAAFVLLRSRDGCDWLRDYYRRYLRIARATGSGFVLETPTWRASPDWAWQLDVAFRELDALNMAAVTLMRDLGDEYQGTPTVVSGCIGPRRDGYAADLAMTADEAEAYHRRQVGAFARAGADFVTATTMTNASEAIGIARAARAAGLRLVVSFTVETDGRLPTGQPLAQAIAAVDAASDGWPAYYMINCAHPSHFADVLDGGGHWVRRIRGLRANASSRSHAELDEATELDSGCPEDLGTRYRALLRRHPHINVLGGCCGTDHRHVAQIARACAA